MISICIPTYNKPKELGRLLESIACQTYSDIEVIISDDTPDAQILQKVIADYPQLRIQYYHHSKSLGSPANWNFAYDKAKGEYVKLMHDDDWFAESNVLAQLVTAMQENPFAFCQSKDVDAKGEVVYINKPDPQNVYENIQNPVSLLLGNWIGAPSCVLHKRSSLRYDENLRWFVDVDFYIMQMFQIDGRVSYLPFDMVNIGVDGARVTNECIANMEVIGREYFYCLRKYRRLHIISIKEYCYLTYCFIRDYKLKSHEELKPYCNSVLGKIMFWMYKLRKL